MAIQQRNSDGTIKSDYGDTDDERYCPECKKSYSVLNFYKDSRGVNGLTRRCKECHSKRSYQSRKKRPRLKSERYENLRRWRLAKKYNMTTEEFSALLKKQRGKCRICGTKSEHWWTNEFNGGLHIDHHHGCGSVRGLLCSDCNTALGLLKENEKLFIQAAKYLKNSRCCEELSADVQG